MPTHEVTNVEDQMKDVDGAVLYCDGGYRQQYNSGGWGIHGYIYKKEEPKKGTGNPKAVPTENGYLNENTDGAKVTIKGYVDGVGGVPDALSNNHTELVAMNRALKWINENKIADAKIYSDSQYVVRGLDGWVDRWNKNGWKNSQGLPVSSKDLWIETDALFKTVKESSSCLIQWIKGHNGHIGNVMADYWATCGNMLGRKGLSDEQLNLTTPEGYWNKKSDTNPMISGSYWYFQSTDDAYKTEQGEHIYYHGDHGSDDDMLGKPMTETCHSVVFSKEPDPVLEILRQDAAQRDVSRHGSVFLGYLTNIFNGSVYTDVLANGTKFTDYGDHKLDTRGVGKRTLVLEQKPAWLALLAVDELNALQKRLEAYRAMETSSRVDFIVTDITDLIYDLTDEKGKVKTTLKKDITQSTKSLDVEARYTTKVVPEISGQDDPSITTTSVRLVVGRDIPKRNCLANLTGLNPKVCVVTWRESSTAFRFATIVECDLGIGIWAGVYSNLQLV